MRYLLALALGCMTLLAQVVQESFARDPGPLDFIRGEGFEQAILQALTGDSLVGMDTQGRLVPRLAERWERKGDVLRLFLRQDARFVDGSPVRPEDALWTMQTLQNDPKASPTKRGILEGLRVRVRSGVLELSGARPPERLLRELIQVPIAKAGHADQGCGPFSLRMQGGEWHLAARSHFLHPAIPGLRFRLIADEQALLQNLQKGWLSIGVPPSRRGLKPPPSHREIRQPLHAQLLVWSRAGVGPLGCLERWRGEAIPDSFFGGQARPSRGLFPESLGFAVRHLGDRVEAPAQGTRWEILFTAGDEPVGKFLLALRERAKREGVLLEPRPVEAAVLFERLTRGDFQLACAVNVFEPHPWSVLDLLTPKGGMNFAGWRHPKLASLLPRLTETRTRAWDELQVIWAEAPTSLPLLDYLGGVWVDRRLEVTPSALGLYLSTPGAAGWKWQP
jgi:hypothetical protein